MEQVKVFKVCLPQILLGPLLNTWDSFSLARIVNTEIFLTFINLPFYKQAGKFQQSYFLFFEDIFLAAHIGQPVWNSLWIRPCCYLYILRDVCLYFTRITAILSKPLAKSWKFDGKSPGKSGKKSWKVLEFKLIILVATMLYLSRKNVLDQTQKAFNTKFGPPWKD